MAEQNNKDFRSPCGLGSLIFVPKRKESLLLPPTLRLRRVKLLTATAYCSCLLPPPSATEENANIYPSRTTQKPQSHRRPFQRRPLLCGLSVAGGVEGIFALFGSSEPYSGFDLCAKTQFQKRRGAQSHQTPNPRSIPPAKAGII